MHTRYVSGMRRDGWIIRGGTDDDGWDVHLAFLLASLLAVPTLVWLIVVAMRTSGVARLGAVVGAAALGLLIAWTAALFAFLLRLGRRLRSKK